MVDSLIILVVLFAFIASGFLRGKSDATKDIGVYTIGDRDRNWFQIAAGISMTYVGGAATLNMTSLGYTYGFAAMIDPAAVFGGILIVTFFIDQYRRDQCFTITSTLARSDRSLAVFLGLVSAVVYTLMSAAQFVALSKLLSPFFTFLPIYVLILVPSSLVFLYVFFGGFRSVNFTDVLQYIAVVSFFLVPIVYIVGQLVPDNLVERSDTFSKMSPNLAILLGFSLLFVPLSQDIKIRTQAARDDVNARKGVLIGGLSYVAIVGAAVYAGRELNLVGIGLSDSEMALPTLFERYLGGIGILATLAVLAAIVSTLDSFALAAVAAVANDIIKPETKSGERGALLASSAVVFGLAMILALWFQNILGLILTGLLIYVSVLAPIALGRFLNVADRRLLVTGLITVVAIVCVEVFSLNIEPKAIFYPIGHAILVLFVFAVTRFERANVR